MRDNILQHLGYSFYQTLFLKAMRENYTNFSTMFRGAAAERKIDQTALFVAAAVLERTPMPFTGILCNLGLIIDGASFGLSYSK